MWAQKLVISSSLLYCNLIYIYTNRILLLLQNLMGFLLQLMETRHYAIMTEDINYNLYVI